MIWTLEKVVAQLGDEAQIVPGGVIKHHFDAETGRARNVLVAELLNGVFSVTSEGLALLESTEQEKLQALLAEAQVVAAHATKQVRRRRVSAQAAPVDVPEQAQGLQLSLNLPPGFLEGEPEPDLDLPSDFQEDAD